MRDCYEIYLDGDLVDESNYEYDSESEADSEGNFAVRSLADASGRHWSEYTVVVRTN